MCPAMTEHVAGQVTRLSAETETARIGRRLTRPNRRKPLYEVTLGGQVVAGVVVREMMQEPPRWQRPSWRGTADVHA